MVILSSLWNICQRNGQGPIISNILPITSHDDLPIGESLHSSPALNVEANRETSGTYPQIMDLILLHGIYKPARFPILRAIKYRITNIQVIAHD